MNRVNAIYERDVAIRMTLVANNDLVVYTDSAMAARYSSDAEDYPRLTRQGLLEMNRQVGVAKPGADGLMKRGLMIRHLIMPNNVGGTDKVLRWIAGNLPKDTYVNLMDQYSPAGKVGAGRFGEIDRRISTREFADARRFALGLGLRLDERQTFSVRPRGR